MKLKELHYESTNEIYKIMASLASRISNDKLKINQKSKVKNELLYDLQMKIRKLFEEINKIISGKKGSVRATLGRTCPYMKRFIYANSSNCWELSVT